MLVIYLPVLICILGALMHLLASSPGVRELGRLAFAIGLFAALTSVGGAHGLVVR